MLPDNASLLTSTKPRVVLWGKLWEFTPHEGLGGSTDSYDAALCEVCMRLLSCSLLLGLCMKCAPKGSGAEGLIDTKQVDPVTEKGCYPEGSDFVNRLTSDGINSLISLPRVQ